MRSNNNNLEEVGTFGDPMFLVITWPSYINVRTATTPFFALAARESLTRISLFSDLMIRRHRHPYCLSIR